MLLRRLTALGLLAALLATAACAPASANGIEVREPRVVIAGHLAHAGGNAAAYFTVINHGRAPDRLLGVETSAARSAALHLTTMDDDVMRMRPVEFLDIPAGETIVLEPGGYHAMLTETTPGLAVGVQVALRLTFEQAGLIEVAADVRAP